MMRLTSFLWPCAESGELADLCAECAHVNRIAYSREKSVEK